MGASGSTYSHFTPSATGKADDGDTSTSCWLLPPASEDEVWLNLNLLAVVSNGEILARGARDFSRSRSEPRTDGNTRDSQPIRSSKHGHTGEDDDFLDGALCLSMSSLRREEMAVMVENAKNRLLGTLSSASRQDDSFHEGIDQRMHTIQCVQAAMTRHRQAQLPKAGGNGLGSQAVDSAQNGSGGRSIEVNPPASHGENLLGLHLFFSLLHFVQEPDCGREQIADFLLQIRPVLSSLPPLCLAIGDEKQSTQRTTTPGVVHSLRKFLVKLAVGGQGDSEALHLETEQEDSVRQELCFSEQREAALSAMISLVAARGQASDLLALVKVLLHKAYRKQNAVGVEPDEDDAATVPPATGLMEEDLTAEYNAKRYVAVRRTLTLGILSRILLLLDRKQVERPTKSLRQKPQCKTPFFRSSPRYACAKRGS